MRFSGNIRMVLCDLDVITWRGRSIFSILVTLCYLNKSCVFYVNSNCVLELHIEILWEEFLHVSSKTTLGLGRNQGRWALADIPKGLFMLFIFYM